MVITPITPSRWRQKLHLLLDRRYEKLGRTIFDARSIIKQVVSVRLLLIKCIMAKPSILKLNELDEAAWSDIRCEGCEG